jgi:hypothetical protein
MTGGLTAEFGMADLLLRAEIRTGAAIVGRGPVGELAAGDRPVPLGGAQRRRGARHT